MRYTVYDLITDVKRKIHGGSVPSNIQGPLDEARRNFILQVKPPEMQRKAIIEQALFDQVEFYAVPEDVTYEDVADLKMLEKDHNLDSLWKPVAHVYRRQIDAKNRENIFDINWDSGVKSMQIWRPKGLRRHEHVIINEFNSLTENGTWNAGGNIVNLRLDELNHVTRKASLAFDINNSSNTGFIENFTMRPVDISDYLSTGSAFEWLNFPLPENVIAVKLTLGSDPNNLTNDIYYSTVNQPHDNNEFISGWNLLKYVLNTMNTTGNPNPKAIAYIRIDITTNSQPIPNCNIDSLIVRKGHVFEMIYNSSYCLIDPLTRAWKMKTTKNSDQFPFEEHSYQLIMLETALVVQKDLYANNSGAKSDVTGIENELTRKYAEYKRQHKAEIIEPEQYTNVMGRFKYGNQDNGGRHRHRDDGWHDSDPSDSNNN